jgi:hypothetical protein
MLSAKDYARVCVSMGWDFEECVQALKTDHNLSEPDARELMSSELRSLQEVEIEDTHDEIEEE